jgi:hypothetical protein
VAWDAASMSGPKTAIFSKWRRNTGPLTGFPHA